jgi:hypothetical protein
MAKPSADSSVLLLRAEFKLQVLNSETTEMDGRNGNGNKAEGGSGGYWDGRVLSGDLYANSGGGSGFAYGYDQTPGVGSEDMTIGYRQGIRAISSPETLPVSPEMPGVFR